GGLRGARHGERRGRDGAADRRASHELVPRKARSRGVAAMMVEPLRGRKRTHRCGDLRAEHAGEKVRLMGWAHRVRDHGGVLFLDLRDRYGITQVVFRPETLEPPMLEKARSIGSEYVVL